MTLRPLLAFCLPVFLVLAVLTGRAADVSVSAELSPARINFGEMAELRVKVTGTQQADVPQQIAADGLQIRLSGQSAQFQMVNFKTTSSIVYSYVILPQRTGNFTIPGITVTAEGKPFRTRDLSFSVTDAIAGPVPAPPPSAAPQGYPPGMAPYHPPAAARGATQGRVAFAEISCPKRTLYVGEAVPVEIRCYFDAAYQVQVRGKVDFGGEGVVTERFPDPKESREERDGVIYNVLTFRTLLSAVKPGTIELPPAKLNSLIQMPGAVPPGFDDPIFRQLMGRNSPFMESRELTVKSASLHLEILPLPKEGRPASFAGAVGQFDLDTVVPNPKPAPGDPVTLRVKIGGKGNFKGMGAPLLTETEGWRSYPPTDKFEGSDDLSHSGVNSFDFTLIAQEPKTASPGAEFSYFDPVAAKYVTLTAKPIPVQASPGASTNAPQPAAPVATPGNTGNSPAVGAGVREGEPAPAITLRSWVTPVRRIEFLIATGAMILAVACLSGILWYRDLQTRGGSARTRRRRRIAELLESLRSGSLDSASSYEAALEYAELALAPSEKLDLLVASLTQRRDLLKYGIGGSRPLDAAERERILSSLEELPLRK